jgi:hypothetical protein
MNRLKPHLAKNSMPCKSFAAGGNMRKTKIKVLVASLLLMATWTSQAESSNCSIGFYQNVLNQVQSLERSGKNCESVTRHNQIDVARACRACRPAISKVFQLERSIRTHRGCFNPNDTQHFISEVSRYRSLFKFFRRGCGY